MPIVGGWVVQGKKLNYAWMTFINRWKNIGFIDDLTHEIKKIDQQYKDLNNSSRFYKLSYPCKQIHLKYYEYHLHIHNWVKTRSKEPQALLYISHSCVFSPKYFSYEWFFLQLVTKKWLKLPQ
jgi:hypothetical protein